MLSYFQSLISSPMATDQKRGLLIVFEGIWFSLILKKYQYFNILTGLDRSGKSTQAKRLVESINKKSTESGDASSSPSAVLQAFPGLTRELKNIFLFSKIQIVPLQLES